MMTDQDETRYLVQRFASDAYTARMAYLKATSERDEAIRKAHALGIPQRELMRLTGLSRAQVQRLCDLSARKEA